MTTVPAPTPARVAVLEPRRLVREALLALLADDTRLAVVDGAAATRALPDAQLYVTSDAALAQGRPWVSVEHVDVLEPGALEQVVVVALRAAVAHGPVAVDRPPAAPAAAALSQHERAVLTCISEGLTAVATAQRLGVSRKSVENAKRRLFLKLGARSQAEAIALDHAARHGTGAG